MGQRDHEGGDRGGAETRGGRSCGVEVQVGQHLVGRISTGQEIDEGDGKTTDDQTPGSGQAKIGGEVTIEWSYLMGTE